MMNPHKTSKTQLGKYQVSSKSYIPKNMKEIEYPHFNLRVLEITCLRLSLGKAITKYLSGSLLKKIFLMWTISKVC